MKYVNEVILNSYMPLRLGALHTCNIIQIVSIYTQINMCQSGVRLIVTRSKRVYIQWSFSYCIYSTCQGHEYGLLRAVLRGELSSSTSTGIHSSLLHATTTKSVCLVLIAYTFDCSDCYYFTSACSKTFTLICSLFHHHPHDPHHHRHHLGNWNNWRVWCKSKWLFR